MYYNKQHMDNNPHSPIGVLFAVAFNLFVWISDAVQSDEFSVVTRLLGFIALILSICNSLGFLDEIKNYIKKKFF